MKAGGIIASVIGILAVGGAAFWWLKTGRYSYFIPEVKITNVDVKSKTLSGTFGNKPFTYSHREEMYKNILGERKFVLKIKQYTTTGKFPTNLGFSIYKGGKLRHSPSPNLPGTTR